MAVYAVTRAESRSRVEKYRPQTLGDLISHQDVLSTSEYPCQLLLPLWEGLVTPGDDAVFTG